MDSCCNNSDGYSKYLVIFIDILGTKSRVGFSEQYNINRIFHDEFEKNQGNNQDYTVYFRKIYTFSDCAYIFYGFKDGVPEDKKNRAKLFTTALCNCEPIFLSFLTENIIFRGGVCYGDAYVDMDRSMFFGEAVNKAYRMESTEAVNPRIIVDDNVANDFIENVKSVSCELAKYDENVVQPISMGIIPRYPDTGDGLIEKDIDGRYVINYFHCLYSEKRVLVDGKEVGKELIDNLIAYCEEQIEKNKCMKVIDKYMYLLRFCQSKKKLHGDNASR